MRRRHEQKILKADMVQYLNENFKNSSDEMLIAQGVTFFGAGFETTTNLLQMICYELAKNENVQIELASEIEKVNLELSGKRVSYETLDKMRFLNCVVMETLRLWPPSFTIDRSCNSECKLVGNEGTVYEFKENDQIIVPVHELHRDERYFENPNNFMPRRFEDTSRIICGTYLPYGMGARCCLGQKFSTIVVKLLIFHLLGCYRIKICDKLRAECEFDQPLIFTKLKKSKSTSNLLK
jgi:cytochrome P450